ncbi:hypothetical protein [Runella slithyformis]|uniref:Uncharacterized protein n=1 Tax=Runella slithyformis (strain ATCC 29530 / DSM 19594 / LMG 11500 / NCIMB 11436 / LSU 4) TaxID=761193 RepID=A0A7U3ZI99_RUNSL|nr:hypothetical protein [Runella slithyformis]AEI47680.1 hypothetical protein Runsl_1253 [Runella slithyformis DSM 19594]
MTKHAFNSFIVTLLMMICLSNSIQSQSRPNLIPVDRERLKTVMEKAELYEVTNKEVTVLLLENSRLKESIAKEKQAGQVLRNELEEVSNAYDTTRIILFALGLLIIAYVIIQIRSR